MPRKRYAGKQACCWGLYAYPVVTFEQSLNPQLPPKPPQIIHANELFFHVIRQQITESNCANSLKRISGYQALEGFVGSSCSLARYVWWFSQRLVPTAITRNGYSNTTFTVLAVFFQNLLSIRLRSRIEQKCNEKGFCTFRERSVWSH